jgi:hypothetical protein
MVIFIVIAAANNLSRVIKRMKFTDASLEIVASIPAVVQGTLCRHFFSCKKYSFLYNRSAIAIMLR